ncbi:hypothetical protein AB0D12_06170 [Streptomyces sp. NPDC048479]|uniref:hypothetical protein n=1 Tax=Streptomyces sp. NPDC048479 TaxID=3154725 RepID=UPI00344350FC
MDMMRLALRTLRFRKGGFLATFVALFFGTVIVLACGGLLETGIRNNVPPERLAGASLVVVGDRSYELHPGDPEKKSERVVLAERVPLDAALVGVLLGTVATATTLVPFAHAAADSWLPSGPLWIYGTVVGTALTPALSATLVPAWRALKVLPVRAARAES